MHILVATDGTLDVERAADAVARYYTQGDEVTVFTAINIPTDGLEHIGDPGVRKAMTVALEAGQGFTAGDRAAEQLAPPRDHHADADARRDNPVLKSLAKTGEARTSPVVAALKERGVVASSQWTTTNNRTARTIITAMKRYDTDLLVVGSHGGGRFEGLLGSTGTKLMRLSPASVLMIRNAKS